MPEKQKKDALAPTDKRVRHGLRSWVNSKRVPYGRTFQVVRRELAVLQEDLIQQHCGKDITPDARILVDSVIEGLGVQKLLGLYVRKYGVIDNRAAKQGRLELSPILGKSWVAYSNVVRQGILALKELEKDRQGDHGGPTLEAIRAEYEVQAEDAPGSAQEGQTEADEGQVRPIRPNSGKEFARDIR
jgi:hypothetical protein